MENANQVAQFPNLTMRGHLVVDLQSIGYAMQSEMGNVAVSHSELRAWACNTGVRFEGAEAEWLNKMSEAYAIELARSSDKDTAAPFDGTKDV